LDDLSCEGSTGDGADGRRRIIGQVILVGVCQCTSLKEGSIGENIGVKGSVVNLGDVQ
jgi:hypothetical protein